MEDAPLVGGGSSSTALRRYKVLLYIFSALFVTTLALTIVFSVLYSHEKGKNDNPPQPEPTPAPNADYDHSDDFPLNPVTGWNITDSPPTRRTLAFQTTNATWTNIDVYGGQIVFDILGDIYVIPIAGGLADVLRPGVPFETQARFSPDGSKILFTSDLSGSDNVWIMDINTKEATQVTFENYHFVSNAFWINKDSIVAVKWYTSTRSISAGEIWVYNVTTTVPGQNPGMRVVGRSAISSQVGPEEPVPLHIAATGETQIFYSKNVMDGNTWSYSKDPHQTIYAIMKYSTTTKQSTVISRGPGGAARPIISHSGTTLAFIKRTEYQTSLMLHDLASGNDQILWQNLDFDQQESSAPAGVYPGFAFTSDDSAIIVWAQGHIYTVDIKTGVASIIQYTANIQLDISPTVRYQQPIADAPTFATKIVQNPSVSGNKTLFAFTSLATTYLYSEGNVFPLESQDTFQFWPALSNDNNLLVHVLWDDQSFATIELVVLASRVKYTVPTISIGRYIQPQFSPSGNSIVYIRLPGDYLSGGTWGLNAGVYMNTITVEANGTIVFGPPTLVTSGVWSVAFSASGNSILTQSGSYPLSLSEVSVESGKVGASLSTLATSLYSTEIAVSPDKRHVVFIEFQKVYIASYQAALKGGPMNVTAISKGGASTLATLRLLSNVGGQSVTWSYDSTRAYWAWGPILYELVVPADLTACSASCITDNIKTYNLTINAPSTVVPDTQVVVFDNVTIITMEDDNPEIPNGRIVVHGSRISALGTVSEVPVPENATIVNLNGGYVMPGLIDAHAHWGGASDYYYKVKADWEMFVNLAYGVTTLHNPSADTLSTFADAELIKAGKKVGPRIFTTGTIIYGAGGPLHCDISSLADATAYLETLKAVGAWSVKTYNQPSRASRQMILLAARNLEMNVVPEGGMSFFWNLNQIIDGHTTIEHSIPMAPLYNDVITLFSQSGTAWTPTLIVNYGGIFGERYWFQHTEVWNEQRLLTYVPKDVVEPATMRYTGAQDVDYHHFATSRAAAAVNLQGGLIEAGAHGEMQGIGIHWELKMFYQGGLLSNYSVLKTATINAAKALGLHNDIGSLKVGKLADLIFYNSTNNPLDIFGTENVWMVMKDGHLYNAPGLDQVLPTEQQRAPLPPLNEKISFVH